MSANESAEVARKIAFVRNSKKSFLLGASWSHHPSWPTRLTHIYLGPWLLTISTTRPRNRSGAPS